MKFRLSAILGVAVVCLAAAEPSYGQLNPPVPSISGSAVPGQTLICSAPSWDLATGPYSYSWQRDVVTSIGAGTRYTVTAGDVGHAITCQIAVPIALGQTATFTSLPVTPVSLPVAAVPINTSPPAISGNPQPGQTLTCTTGFWINNPTSYSYSWQRDASPIAGQSGSTYKVAASDVNSAVTCTVVGNNASGDGPPALSAPVIVSASSGGGAGGGSSGGSGGSSGGGPGSSGGSGGGGAGGSGGSGGTKVARPKLKSLSVAPRKVTITIGKKKRSTKGTWIRYSLDRAAAVLLYIQQKRHGRWVTVGVVAVRHAGAGSHRVRYNARHGKKVLALGHYRVIAAAANKGGWSNARTAAFALVKKTKPRHKTR